MSEINIFLCVCVCVCVCARMHVPGQSNKGENAEDDQPYDASRIAHKEKTLNMFPWQLNNLNVLLWYLKISNSSSWWEVKKVSKKKKLLESVRRNEVLL